MLRIAPWHAVAPFVDEVVVSFFLLISTRSMIHLEESWAFSFGELLVNEVIVEQFNNCVAVCGM